MNIRMKLLSIMVALCTGSSSAMAEDLAIPEPLATLTYQDQLVACSYFFSEKARTEAAFDDNVEIHKWHATTHLHNMNLVLQPMLKVLQEQAPKLGDAKTLIADTGYCSQTPTLRLSQTVIAVIVPRPCGTRPRPRRSISSAPAWR